MENRLGRRVQMKHAGRKAVGTVGKERGYIKRGNR